MLTLARPQFMRHMLGPAMVETIERHEMWTHSIVGVEPVASSAIMTNNLSVCFIAFAGGIVFGLGPVWSMFFNGLLLGVIGVACAAARHVGGPVELRRAARLAGAALDRSCRRRRGCAWAHGVLFPGLYRRRDSIALAGVEATRLVAGVIPLLVIAGTLEGFFSPSDARRSGSNSPWADCCSRCCWCGCSGRWRGSSRLRSLSGELDAERLHQRQGWF